MSTSNHNTPAPNHPMGLLNLVLVTISMILLTASSAARAPIVVHPDADGWVRPASADSPHIWGHRDGIIFGAPSEGGMRGPRGLIRIGIIDTHGTVQLLNFFAIEPVIKGPGHRHTRMAFSELEMSNLDPERRGKRIWTDTPVVDINTTGTDQSLTVRIEVEPFHNGAHVYLLATMHKSAPHEIQITAHHHKDSTPIDELTITATMGNKTRLRQLWLKDQIIDSRTLYATYTDNHFVEHQSYPREQMLTWRDDPIAIATTNEADPSTVRIPDARSWQCPVGRLTQYWRVPADHVQPNLRTRVNGRRVYWANTVPIPGGVSYENFEIRQRYTPGQISIYGLTPHEPHNFTPKIQNLPHPPPFE